MQGRAGGGHRGEADGGGTQANVAGQGLSQLMETRQAGCVKGGSGVLDEEGTQGEAGGGGLKGDHRCIYTVVIS